MPGNSLSIVMHLIQILIPVFDNAGQRFEQTFFEGVRTQLIERFGGLKKIKVPGSNYSSTYLLKTKDSRAVPGPLPTWHLTYRRQAQCSHTFNQTLIERH